ncbi:MAG: glutamate-ammonia-ligase adenylyltransferase, partial [Mariniblastus sp.]
PKWLESLFACLPRHLPALSDPDRALNNLERLVLSEHTANTNAASRWPLASIPDLLHLLAASQQLADLLIRISKNVTSLWRELWANRGQQFSQSSLTESLAVEIESDLTPADAMATLRRFKQRETLRIGIGDLVENQRIAQVTSQISFVANAIVESSYRWARRELKSRYGEPTNSHETPASFSVLALGKLGGHELNYSSDIDLMMLYDESGVTTGVAQHQRITNQEFFERLCQLITKLIGETTALGTTYRVDLRLRPNGASGKLCNSYASMIQYYDLQGRTWERQALIKAAPIAGDQALGRRLLKELAPWIYRRNLSRADISGIKALKRKIERRAIETGENLTNVKTGRGGIRDVEFIIQFLQLLNGGDLPQVRTTNTLDAIRRLEKEQCLTSAESTVLAKNYAWLRKLEHRLQMMFDLQTHSIPTDRIELNKIAKRMGFVDDTRLSALIQFKSSLVETTESNRRILNHLLHGAFGMAFGSMRNTGGGEHRLDRDEVPLEVDLILDPDPGDAMIEQVLRPYGFQNPSAAHGHLMDLAKEPTRFLSSRRCKHFLASVAPALLKELSYTPDPDQALVTLATVSEHLGAKGVLWELFNFNPPTLSLYVRLCASSDYLTGILKSNPGMIDELVDALQMDGLPSRHWLESNIDELTRGATDLTPILHSFKNTQHMRVGIRDILGRDDVRDTHQALSDVAGICIQTAARMQFDRLFQKFGTPQTPAPSDAKPAGQFVAATKQAMDCPLVILGLGKLGGREPNYHSDLDVIFLYDPIQTDGQPFADRLADGITSQFFFSELAAEITKFLSHQPGFGRLYEVDSRLRPTGKSGALAVSMAEFERYFNSQQGKLWERQALCKARPVFGSNDRVARAMSMVRQAIQSQPWQANMVQEIREMRLAMEKGSTEQNLKRGAGGTVDVEFATQMLQLKHVVDDPSVLVPGTRDAIEKFQALGVLNDLDARQLGEGYQALRSVEARLRLMNTTARHDLPKKPKQLEKLAYLLHYANGQSLTDAVNGHRVEIRRIFNSLTS